MTNDLIFLIESLSKERCGFSESARHINEQIAGIDRQCLISLVREIGTIPESLDKSSTEEKLFSKASDCILARSFTELGIPAVAVRERGNSADIVAKSIHGYTLVADAKTFRLSRTAKNQKDFKIDTLSNWRGSEHDFAILVAPYFQYPNTASQIYSNALDKQVCLFSWEHVLYLLLNNVSEDENFSLETLWNAPVRLARDTRIAYADRMNCQFPYINKITCDRISRSPEDFDNHLKSCKEYIRYRGNSELQFLKAERDSILEMTREQAITELLNSKKVNQRIGTIEKFMALL